MTDDNDGLGSVSVGEWKGKFAVMGLIFRAAYVGFAERNAAGQD